MTKKTNKEAERHKGNTPYSSIQDAREAYREFIQKGCECNLHLYQSVDSEYDPGYLISFDLERTVIGERRVKFVETLHLAEYTH